MIIGITINNILRDHITQLRKAYSLLTEKEPIEPINPFDLETSFPTVESEIASQEFKPNNDTEMVLDMVANEQDDNFNVFEFMYEEASFEVFGRSDEAIDGLLNKLKAYKLQEQGRDTVEANLELGFAMDERDYGVGAQILRDLGVHKIRLISNNPKKRAGLMGYGLEIVDSIAIEIPANPHNKKYLETKRDKMGHTLKLDK